MSLLIVFNNYFHDLATGVFVACAITLWAIARTLQADPLHAETFRPLYDALTRALWIAFAWIILGGIPRTIFFPTYEFIPAMGKGIVPALVIKHVFLFTGVGLGVAAWIAARRMFSVAANAEQDGIQ